MKDLLILLGVAFAGIALVVAGSQWLDRSLVVTISAVCGVFASAWVVLAFLIAVERHWGHGTDATSDGKSEAES